MMNWEYSENPNKPQGILKNVARGGNDRDLTNTIRSSFGELSTLSTNIAEISGKYLQTIQNSLAQQAPLKQRIWKEIKANEYAFRSELSDKCETDIFSNLRRECSESMSKATAIITQFKKTMEPNANLVNLLHSCYQDLKGHEKKLTETFELNKNTISLLRELNDRKKMYNYTKNFIPIVECPLQIYIEFEYYLSHNPKSPHIHVSINEIKQSWTVAKNEMTTTFIKYYPLLTSLQNIAPKLCDLLNLIYDNNRKSLKSLTSSSMTMAEIYQQYFKMDPSCPLLGLKTNETFKDFNNAILFFLDKFLLNVRGHYRSCQFNPKQNSILNPMTSKVDEINERINYNNVERSPFMFFQYPLISRNLNRLSEKSIFNNLFNFKGFGENSNESKMFGNSQVLVSQDGPNYMIQNKSKGGSNGKKNQKRTDLDVVQSYQTEIINTNGRIMALLTALSNNQNNNKESILNLTYSLMALQQDSFSSRYSFNNQNTQSIISYSEIAILIQNLQGIVEYCSNSNQQYAFLSKQHIEFFTKLLENCNKYGPPLFENLLINKPYFNQQEVIREYAIVQNLIETYQRVSELGSINSSKKINILKFNNYSSMETWNSSEGTLKDFMAVIDNRNINFFMSENNHKLEFVIDKKHHDKVFEQYKLNLFPHISETRNMLAKIDNLFKSSIEPLVVGYNLYKSNISKDNINSLTPTELIGLVDSFKIELDQAISNDHLHIGYICGKSRKFCNLNNKEKNQGFDDIWYTLNLIKYVFGQSYDESDTNQQYYPDKISSCIGLTNVDNTPITEDDFKTFDPRIQLILLSKLIDDVSTEKSTTVGNVIGNSTQPLYDWGIAASRYKVANKLDYFTKEVKNIKEKFPSSTLLSSKLAELISYQCSVKKPIQTEILYELLYNQYVIHRKFICGHFEISQLNKICPKTNDTNFKYNFFDIFNIIMGSVKIYLNLNFFDNLTNYSVITSILKHYETLKSKSDLNNQWFVNFSKTDSEQTLSFGNFLDITQSNTLFGKQVDGLKLKRNKLNQEINNHNNIVKIKSGAQSISLCAGSDTDISEFVAKSLLNTIISKQDATVELQVAGPSGTGKSVFIMGFQDTQNIKKSLSGLIHVIPSSDMFTCSFYDLYTCSFFFEESICDSFYSPLLIYWKFDGDNFDNVVMQKVDAFDGSNKLALSTLHAHSTKIKNTITEQRTSVGLISATQNNDESSRSTFIISIHSKHNNKNFYKNIIDSPGLESCFNLVKIAQNTDTTTMELFLSSFSLNPLAVTLFNTDYWLFYRSMRAILNHASETIETVNQYEIKYAALSPRYKNIFNDDPDQHHVSIIKKVKKKLDEDLVGIYIYLQIIGANVVKCTLDQNKQWSKTQTPIFMHTRQNNTVERAASFPTFHTILETPKEFEKQISQKLADMDTVHLAYDNNKPTIMSFAPLNMYTIGVITRSPGIIDYIDYVHFESNLQSTKLVEPYGMNLFSSNSITTENDVNKLYEEIKHTNHTLAVFSKECQLTAKKKFFNLWFGTDSNRSYNDNWIPNLLNEKCVKPVLEGNLFKDVSGKIFEIQDIDQKCQKVVINCFEQKFGTGFLNYTFGSSGRSVSSIFGISSLSFSMNVKDASELTLNDVFFNPLFGMSLMNFIEKNVYESFSGNYVCTSHFANFVPMGGQKTNNNSDRKCFLNTLNTSQDHIVSIHKQSIALFMTKLYYDIFRNPSSICSTYLYHEKMIIYSTIVLGLNVSLVVPEVADKLLQINISQLMQGFQTPVINELNLRSSNNKIAEENRNEFSCLMEAFILNADVINVDFEIPDESDNSSHEIYNFSSNTISPFHVYCSKSNSKCLFKPDYDNTEKDYVSLFTTLNTKLKSITPDRMSILKQKKINNFLSTENETFDRNKVPFLNNSTHFGLIVANQDKILNEHTNSKIATGLGYLNIFGLGSVEYDDQSATTK